MFEKILADLSMPAEGLECEIRSFIMKGNGSLLAPTDYLIHSERHGFPQSRHRVILLEVRKRLDMPQHQWLARVARPVTVKQVIDDLPGIRSKLSRGDSVEAWRKAVQAAPSCVKGWNTENECVMIETMRAFAATASCTTAGGAFISRGYRRPKKPTELQQWLHDRSLGGVCQHAAQSHMRSKSYSGPPRRNHA